MFNYETTKATYRKKDNLWDFTISGRTWVIPTQTLNTLESFWVSMYSWPDDAVKHYILTTSHQGRLERLLCIDELKRRTKIREASCQRN